MEPLKPKDPKQVGDWTLVARLGVGGMGIVYLAARGTQNAALKVIHSHLTDDENWLLRFKREVEVLSRVRGERVAQILDSDLTSDPAWVATEFVNGPDLRMQVETNGNFSEGDWFDLAEGLVSAINDIHAANIIHRDIKPGNILFTNSGPKIIDFGIALTAESTSLTTTGLVTGSPAWLAPEQIAGQQITAATDIFSLGSALVFAGLGRSPWAEGEDVSTPILFHRILSEEPNLEGLTDSQKSIVRPILNKRSEDRPNATELIKNLKSSKETVKARKITALKEKETKSLSIDEVKPKKSPDASIKINPTSSTNTDIFVNQRNIEKTNEDLAQKIEARSLTKTSIHVPAANNPDINKIDKPKKSKKLVVLLSLAAVVLVPVIAYQAMQNSKNIVIASPELENSASQEKIEEVAVDNQPQDALIAEEVIEEPPIEPVDPVENESAEGVEETPKSSSETGEVISKESISNECEKGISCKIGDKGPAGGVIFYVAKTRQSWGQYLEAAPRDLKGSHLFCDPPLVEPNGPGDTHSNSAIGLGKVNTAILLTYCTGGAVSKASEYSTVSGGVKYSDWFLPSEQELRELYKRKNLLTGIGRVAYWSSTESWKAQGVLIDFEIGTNPAAWGQRKNYIRPIRAF